MPTASSIRKILIVEDEGDLARLLRDVLEDEGFVVATHPNGDCLHLIRSFAPDVMLCDYMLPRYDGREDLRRIRNDGPADLPVILLSAGKIDNRWREWGADDFLEKPFDIERLMAAVHRAIGRDALRWSVPRSSDDVGEQAS